MGDWTGLSFRQPSHVEDRRVFRFGSFLSPTRLRVLSLALFSVAFSGRGRIERCRWIESERERELAGALSVSRAAGDAHQGTHRHILQRRGREKANREWGELQDIDRVVLNFSTCRKRHRSYSGSHFSILLILLITSFFLNLCKQFRVFKFVSHTHIFCTHTNIITVPCGSGVYSFLFFSVNFLLKKCVEFHYILKNC